MTEFSNTEPSPSPGIDKSAKPSGGFFYRAFGLRLSSDFVLGELEAAPPGPVDLEVCYAAVPRRAPEINDAPHFEFFEEGAYLGWPGFARFHLHFPARVEVELEPESHETLLALPLLGPIMALILFKRGYHVLHGSAVGVEARGAMFLGDKEAGKSTTAAAMLAAGWDLLTDDVVAVDLSVAPPRILTAYPSLKLTETASAHFAPQDAVILERPFVDFPKDRYRLDRSLQDDSTPAYIAYILERAAGSMTSTPLKGQEALSAILRFSYLVRFGENLLHGVEAARHFQLCVALARAVSVRRLQVPNALAEVRNTPTLIAAELASI